jgi:acetyl esterase/lipase
MDRRSFLALPRTMDPTEIIRLWPDTPPGGAGLSLNLKVEDRSKDPGRHERLLSQTPEAHLWVCRPDNPNGSAVLVIPGGGYTVIVVDHEGFETARRLNKEGITAFVLQYRLPGEGWADGANVPLQDMQRAMRLIRANAAAYGIDPARLGVVGFSAGGHMAATLATRFAEAVYAPVDAADRIDPKPAFAGLIYPVITLGEGTHAGSRDHLLGADQTAARIAAYSCDQRVTSATVPSFLSFGANDLTVPPVPNALAMYKALAAANVPVEMHAFEDGPHGFGLTSENPKGERNAALFIAWATRNGWFGAQPGKV